MSTCCFHPLTWLLLIAYGGPQGTIPFHVSLGLVPQLFSDIPSHSWTRCYYPLTLLSLRVMQGPMQSGVFSCWLYIYFAGAPDSLLEWEVKYVFGCLMWRMWLGWLLTHRLLLCPKSTSQNTQAASKFKRFVFQAVQFNGPFICSFVNPYITTNGLKMFHITQ